MCGRQFEAWRFDDHQDDDGGVDDDGENNSKEVDEIVADSASDAVEAASRVDALVNALQISSQLARNSEKHYGLLISVFTAQKLYWILTGTNHTAAAKCCNLIGNLCR